MDTMDNYLLFHSRFSIFYVMVHSKTLALSLGDVGLRDHVKDFLLTWVSKLVVESNNNTLVFVQGALRTQ